VLIGFISFIIALFVALIAMGVASAASAPNPTG
jgi:hypothetical protein